MSPGSLFCEYIYGSFLIVEAALETTLSVARSTLRMLSTMFDAVMNLFRFTIDTAVATIIDGVRVLQKKLVDLIWDGYKDDGTGKKKSIFCNNLYKCNIFIEELTDANSLICKTLKKLGVLTEEQRSYINTIITDYDQFMNTICTYGFTFNFGLSALKKLLGQYKKLLDGFLDMIQRKKEDIRRFIQKYINKLEDTGIFDLLAKLRKFFNCILEQTDSCATLKTAQNFYTDTLAKLKIEEAGSGGYRLNTQLSNQIYNAFTSRINLIDNTKGEIQRAVDALMSPSDVKASSKAFNLAKNVFPGGMTWTDVKEGNLKKNRMIHYFVVKGNEFLDAFYGRHESEWPEGCSTEYVLNGMTIDDEKGVIKIEINSGSNRPISETITMNDNVQGVELKTLDTPIDYYVVGNTNPDAPDAFFAPDSDTIISAKWAAIDMAVNNNEKLKNHVQKTIANLTGMIDESELAVMW